MFQVKKIKKWSIRDRNNIRTSELMNFISGWTIPLRDILHWKSCHVFWLSGMLLRGISKQTFALSFSSTQTSVILWKNNRIVHSQNAPRSRVQCPVSGACQGRSCIFSAIWQREAQTSHLKLHNSQQSHSCTPTASTRRVDKLHDIRGHQNGRLHSTCGTVG